MWMRRSRTLKSFRNFSSYTPIMLTNCRKHHTNGVWSSTERSKLLQGPTMIESRHNPQFKELKSLLEPRGAKKAGKVLVSGRKIVPELMEHCLFAVCEDGFWPD